MGGRAEGRGTEAHVMTSLDNALRLLDILRVRGGLGVTELARLGGVGKSSAYNMLATLERRGYVRKSARARYYLGDKFFDNDLIEDSSEHLLDVASPFVKRVMAQTGQTAWLAILNVNGRVTALISEEGTRPGHAPGRLGVESGAHCVAPGKVLLAHLSTPMFEALYQGRSLKRYTDATVVDPDALERELSGVRRRGFATDYDERHPGFGNVAVPVREASGACLAALSVVGASYELRAHEREYVAVLEEAAAGLEARLRA